MSHKYAHNIEVAVRAIIVHKHKILLCRMISRNYYFFPGGHVEYKESLSRALKREIKEELGVNITRAKLIGMIENIYNERKDSHHEINFVYQVTLNNYSSLSLEEHIDFEFLSWPDFKKIKVYPLSLQTALHKWRQDKKFFIVNAPQ